MHKYDLIKHLHKLYRQDPWIQQMFNSAGLALDNLEDTIEDMKKQYWFDEMTDFGINKMENMLNFKTNSTASIEDRRSQLQARWKSNGKCDVYLLQAVCDSWKNGDIDIQFVNGNIQAKFVGEYGIPDDLEGLQKALDEVKPAHLILMYSFKYLFIKDIDNKMTLEDLEKQTLDKFAF